MRRINRGFYYTANFIPICLKKFIVYGIWIGHKSDEQWP
jgi:hypothetical protein